MSDRPNSVTIREVGPREGMQIEQRDISTADKIRLIDLISDSGVSDIEVTSFVSPERVPKMADAEQVVAGITRRENVRYSCLYLNEQGLKRALATKRLDVRGALLVSASKKFSEHNSRRTIDQVFGEMLGQIELLLQEGVPISDVSIMAAFGCNYEGNVSVAQVLSCIERCFALANDFGVEIPGITLADTMGWANPKQVQGLVGSVRDRWPEKRIRLHLHDTRGMGLACAFAALELGVREFDASIGGLGGCPFGGFRGAAGNIATEDLVHMCGSMGINTGIDIDRILDATAEAERIVGHELPGKLLRGASLIGRGGSS